MLKFFRKIRFKLFTNNRLSQYFIYAIGEVALVIIGILIAVSLNNANEARKEKADIDNLLKQVQSELMTNIQNIDQIYLYYGQKDSLIYNFLNEIVPSQQLDDRLVGAYISVTLNYNSMEVESGAFEALMKKSEFLPENYLPVFEDLKSLYTQRKESLEIMIDLISKSIDKSLDYLGTTQPWYADLFYRNILSEEIKPFILGDVQFINKVSDYANLSSQNFVPAALNFKMQAVESYRAIDDLLGVKSQMVDQSSSFTYNIQDYKNWLGYYRDPIDSDTLQIADNNGQLHAIWQDNDFEIFPINDRDFNFRIPYYVRMNLKEDGTIKEFRGHYPNRRFVYEKLD